MILFVGIAALVLIYGVAYGCFCMKKGGVAAALGVFGLVIADTGLVALLLYFRVRT